MEGARLGAYRVVRDLGSGGMGTVRLARVEDEVLGLARGTRVALKVIHPHLVQTPGLYERFLREAAIGASVDHPNVVRCHACETAPVEGADQHFLVMEYVEGQTLRALLEELDPVPEELCRHIGREMAKGVAAIHEVGAIHRDLKPENVLITPEHVVKIMDLGVARVKDEAIRLSQTGMFVGSLEYAAPEQLRGGSADVGIPADLHALGLILYELSTNTHPYRAGHAGEMLQRILDVKPRPVGSVNPQLTACFEEVVATLLAKDPEERLSSASELLGVLEEGEEGAWWQRRAQNLRRTTRRPLRRIRIPRETGLHGREKDLAALRAAFTKTREGEGQVVLLEGEAGIGKTRLVETFVRRLEEEGEALHVLYGSYPPGGAATAAGAWSTAYREHFGAECLEETLAEHLSVTSPLVPAFAALLRGEPSPKGAAPLTKESLQTIFVHTTRSLATECPTIVVIDDLHFAPEGGRALLAALALSVPGHRILLVGTMRPGVPESWIAGVSRHEHTLRLELGRLGARDLVALLKDAFCSERLAQALGVRIAEKSDGNPFFAFEIIRGLKEDKAIVETDDGSWAATKAIDEILVPSSVQDIVNARMADLSEEERDLLDVASCCGFEFDPGLVAEALGFERLPALKQFGRIERGSRLLRTVGRHCVFDHHQVQESLYLSLLPQLRVEYHAALGEALEARDASPVGADAVALLHHFLEGEREARAVPHLSRALDHLEQRYRNDAALSLTDRALGVAHLLRGRPRVEILLRRNARLDLLGRREEQEATLEEALALAREADARDLEAQAQTAAGMLAWSRARYDEAREHHDRALGLAREAGDERREAMAVGNLGRVHWACGRYDDARGCFERDLELSTRTGRKDAAARATGNLGLVHLAQGRYAQALDHFERWLEHARAAGDRRGEAIATGNMGTVFYATGRLAEARHTFESWIELSRSIGDRQGESKALGNLAACLWAEGFNAQAEVHLEQQLTMVREIGDRRGEAMAIGNLGAFQVEQGRHDEGRASLELALVLHREIGNRNAECLALGNLGIVSQRQGRDDAARGYHAQRIELARQLGDAAGVAESLISLADLGDEAIRHLDEALAIGRERGVAAALVSAATRRARLPGGDVDVAREMLGCHGASVGPAVRLAAHYHLWTATQDMEHLLEARRLLDHLVEHAAPEHREDLLQAVPIHRDILRDSGSHLP